MIFSEQVLVVTVIFITLYSIIELFVRKKERLNIIEKLGEKLDPSMINGKLILPSFKSKTNFSTLKIACLLIGLGVGFMIGVFTDIILKWNTSVNEYNNWMQNTLYTSFVLIFGGLGLLVAFLVERKAIRKDKE